MPKRVNPSPSHSLAGKATVWLENPRDRFCRGLGVALFDDRQTVNRGSGSVQRQDRPCLNKALEVVGWRHFPKGSCKITP